MDALRPMLRQYRELFRSLSAGQRATLLAVPLLVAGVFGFFLVRTVKETHVPLTWGKAFSADELTSAEQALIAAGLTEYRREGERLLVPASEVERYTAALLSGESLPNNYAEELERQLDKQSIFTSERQSRAYRDLALKKELRRIIRAIPDVEDADVVWARGEAGRWPDRGGRVTATVSVRLRGGQELSPQMVQSLRTAVASMVPDLKTADVVVFDLKTGTSHAPGREGDPSDAGLARSRELTHAYQRKISEALSYIPGVLVSVNVDVAPAASRASAGATGHERQSLYRGQPPWPSSAAQQHAVAERQADSNTSRALSDSAPPASAWPAAHGALKLASFEVIDAGAAPAETHGVQVSVQIPEEYYRAVALKRGLREGETAPERDQFRKAIEAIRLQEEKKAQATATVLIPAGSPAGAVAVSSFVPVGETEPADDISPAPRAINSAIGQLGAAIGLGMLALWIVWSRGNAARRPLVPGNAPALEAPLPGAPVSTPVAALKFRGPEPAAESNRPALIFDDLVRFDDRTVRMLLEDVETTCWAVALKGASEEFRRKVFGTVSPRTAELIEEEMEFLGPVRVNDIDAAQRHIVGALGGPGLLDPAASM